MDLVNVAFMIELIFPCGRCGHPVQPYQPMISRNVNTWVLGVYGQLADKPTRRRQTSSLTIQVVDKPTRRN